MGDGSGVVSVADVSVTASVVVAGTGGALVVLVSGAWWSV